MIRQYARRVDVIRSGATLTELKPIGDPYIDANAETDIKMSMSGTFAYNDLVDYLNDELKPYQIIDGVEYPVGVFQIGTYSDHYDSNGVHTIQIEAYDRALRLQQTKTETILHLSAGTNYMQAIESLLVEAGISLYFKTDTVEAMTTDREDWDIGTDYLTIINALLAEINYGSIWFNQDGYAVLQPIKKPSAANIDHEYGGEEFSILKPEASKETDIFDKPNVFIVICENPDLDAPLISIAVNDNPLSALSTFKRGRRIAEVYKVNNIASQEALDEYAQRLCSDSMLSSEIIEISTANMPGHGIYDTVALTHPNLEGIFQETAWSLILAAGQTMTHTLRRSILI